MKNFHDYCLHFYLHNNPVRYLKADAQIQAIIILIRNTPLGHEKSSFWEKKKSLGRLW